MEELLNKWKDSAKDKYSENLSFLNSIRGDNSWDNESRNIHQDVFSKADCLACANCCKTTPALINRSDVKRISKYLEMSPKGFIRKFLLEDINGDMVIQRVPCTFLNEDNTCKIYDVRPIACREYPHTDQKDFNRRSKLNANNTLVCPAAFEIVERLRTIKNTTL